MHLYMFRYIQINKLETSEEVITLHRKKADSSKMQQDNLTVKNCRTTTKERKHFTPKAKADIKCSRIT